jgi:hypothetical protein
MLSHMATLIGGRRARLASAGAACVAAVAGVGLLLRGVTPPADAWFLDHWYAAPGTAAARVATVVSGAGTLLLLGLLVAGAAGVWRRHRAEAPALLAAALLRLGPAARQATS